jgi:hypothetical protein
LEWKNITTHGIVVTQRQAYYLTVIREENKFHVRETTISAIMDSKKLDPLLSIPPPPTMIS